MEPKIHIPPRNVLLYQESLATATAWKWWWTKDMRQENNLFPTERSWEGSFLYFRPEVPCQILSLFWWGLFLQEGLKPPNSAPPREHFPECTEPSQTPSLTCADLSLFRADVSGNTAIGVHVILRPIPPGSFSSSFRLCSVFLFLQPPRSQAGMCVTTQDLYKCAWAAVVPSWLSRNFRVAGGKSGRHSIQFDLDQHNRSLAPKITWKQEEKPCSCSRYCWGTGVKFPLRTGAFVPLNWPALASRKISRATGLAQLCFRAALVPLINYLPPVFNYTLYHSVLMNNCFHNSISGNSLWFHCGPSSLYFSVKCQK